MFGAGRHGTSLAHRLTNEIARVAEETTATE